MNRKLVASGTLEQLEAVVKMARSIGLRVDGTDPEHRGWPSIKGIVIGDGSLCTVYDTHCAGFDNVHIKDLVIEVCKHEPPIMAGEYKAEFSADGVKFGCTFVPKDTVEKVYKKLFSKQ